MKDQFGHYFSHSPEVLKQLTKRVLFSFDASFLLDLYRVNETARSQLFSVLERFSEQLWLTHQAADEFLRNRLNVVASLRNKHRSAANVIDKHIDKLKSELATECANHPHLDATKLVTYFDKAAEDAKRLIEESAPAHPELSNNSEDDPILKRVLNLFEGRVGEPFAEGELPALLKEAERRYQQGIPPGFRDKEKDTNSGGDFLIWKQLMLISKSRKRPVIFVTSDRKDDWWTNLSGKVIGAHPHLRKEFKSETEEEFVLYATGHFGEVFMPKTSERIATLEEIRRVAEASEAERISNDRLGETISTETSELQNLPLQYEPQQETAWSGVQTTSLSQLLEMQNRLHNILSHRRDPAVSPNPAQGVLDYQQALARARQGLFGGLPGRTRLTSQSLFPASSSLGGVRLHSTGAVSPKIEEARPKSITRKKRISSKRASRKKNS